MPTSRGVKADCYTAWFTLLGNLSRPSNRQCFRAFGKINFFILKFKSRFSKLRTATISFLLEVGIFSPSCEEISESSLEMSKSLLHWDTANLIEKIKLFLLFPLSKHGRGFGISDSFLSFVPSLGSFVESFVVNQSYTAQSPPQQRLLLWRWVKSVTKSFFHISQTNILNAKPS